jgi:DNA-binding beta-propeller fold protein YncE
MNRVLASLLVLAACGDNAAAPDARPGADARDRDAAATTPRAVIVAPPANFGPPPGILSTLDVATLEVRQNISAGLVGSDPFVRVQGDTLYIINRSDGNNITVLDATTLGFLDQLGTGPGSNPQDVAVVGDKLYVPALGTTGVVVATRGSIATTTIDLGTPLGDPDGKPDCVSAYAIGTDVYVACDLLDATFTPRGNGKVAVIDTTTDTVRTSFAMPAKNPQNLFVRTPMTSAFGGDLLISTLDFANTTTGCVVRVSTGASPAATCAIQNAALGGTPTHLDVEAGATPRVWLAITSDFTDGVLYAYDLEAGSLGSAVSPGTEAIRDLAVCPDGKVVVTDVTGNGGLRVYDGTTEVTTAELPIGLPPGFGNGVACDDP